MSEIRTLSFKLSLDSIAVINCFDSFRFLDYLLKLHRSGKAPWPRNYSTMSAPFMKRLEESLREVLSKYAADKPLEGLNLEDMLTVAKAKKQNVTLPFSEESRVFLHDYKGFQLVENLVRKYAFNVLEPNPLLKSLMIEARKNKKDMTVSSFNYLKNWKRLIEKDVYLTIEEAKATADFLGVPLYKLQPYIAKTSFPHSPENLSLLRARFDYTQTDLARALGMSMSHLRAIECGQRPLTAKTYARLEYKFGDFLDVLFPKGASPYFIAFCNKAGLIMFGKGEPLAETHIITKCLDLSALERTVKDMAEQDTNGKFYVPLTRGGNLTKAQVERFSGLVENRLFYWA